VTDNLKELLGNPGEVYEGTEPASGNEVEVYVKEMLLNGNEVIVFALVVDDVVTTAYVPTLRDGPSPAGSDYEDVYDREHAINEIIDGLLESYMTKVEENIEIIEEIDEGESP